jgi:hypothetical protein
MGRLKMSRPNLNTPNGRDAYRAELRKVAIGWRAAGLATVALGAAGLIFTRPRGEAVWGATGIGSIAVLAVGWTIVAIAVFKRTQYHRRRMAGGGTEPSANG